MSQASPATSTSSVSAPAGIRIHYPPELPVSQRREDIAVLWQQFVDTRWAESTIRFNRRDGRRRQFAYRIVADDPEPGRHRLRVAEIDPG